MSNSLLHSSAVVQVVGGWVVGGKLAEIKVESRPTEASMSIIKHVMLLLQAGPLTLAEQLIQVHLASFGTTCLRRNELSYIMAQFLAADCPEIKGAWKIAFGLLLHQKGLLYAYVQGLFMSISLMVLWLSIPLHGFSLLHTNGSAMPAQAGSVLSIVNGDRAEWHWMLPLKWDLSALQTWLSIGLPRSCLV